MELLSLLNKLSGVIALVVFFATVIGFYWKIKIAIRELEEADKRLEITVEDIKLDRKERWANYRQDKEKLFEICDNLNKTMAELSGTIKEIKVNLAWIKKEK